MRFIIRTRPLGINSPNHKTGLLARLFQALGRGTRIPGAQDRRRGERGNVFFTLFGAVALVGVIGAATSSLMRGPVGTVVTLNQRTKADTQMQLASKLAMMEASQQASNGDCDADGYVEPIPPETFAGKKCDSGAMNLTGGGCIPDAVGSAKQDPWGTNYGYCGWDHGAQQCGGTDILRGHNAQNETVIAIISAGADRTFQTSCADDPVYVSKPATSDDIVLKFTYAEAVDASNGMWSLKSGAPGTATIDKGIEVSGAANFQSGATIQGNSTFGGGSYDFGGATGLYMPTQANSGACVPSNSGSVRTNNTSGQILQICDPTATTDPDNDHWIDIGGSGAGTAVAGANGEIQFNNQGAFGASSGLKWDAATSRLTTAAISATGDVGIGGNATVAGTLAVTQGASVSGTMGVAGATTINNTLAVSGAVDFDTTLSVGGSTTIGGGLETFGVATFKDDILAKPGSASDPGYAFDGAASSGIYYGSGGLGFSLGGLPKARLTSAGLIVNGGIEASGDIKSLTNVIANANVVGAGIELGVLGSGAGLFTDLAGGFTLNTAGATRMQVDSSGKVGVGISGPATAELDIGGVMRLRKMGAASGGSCGTLSGAITYSSGDQLLVCSDQTGKWETIGTSGGGGGGAAEFWTRLADGRLYYNDGNVGIGVAAPETKLHVADGTLLVTGGSGSGQVSVTGSGSRMFFDPSKAAFRAGLANGSSWDYSNLGRNSAAFGEATQATGPNSFAAGFNSRAIGDISFAIGNYSIASDGGVALGNVAHATGYQAIAIGANLLVTGTNSIGYSTHYSSTQPKISGAGSMAYFLGDQSGVDLTGTGIIGMYGGRLAVDPNRPATKLTPDGSLAVDVEGSVGAINFCDELGTNCFTAADVSGGALGAPGHDREVVFNSSGSLGADDHFTFTPAGRLVVESTLNTNSVVVGGGNESMGGANNTIFGNAAGTGLTTGGYNTLIGRGAGNGITSGVGNTIVGHGANYGGPSTASDNTFLGNSAGYNTTSGGLNLFAGAGAGDANTTGATNVILGASSGKTNTTGSSNVLIGYNVQAPTPTTSNYMNIGNVFGGDMATGNLAVNGTAALRVPVGTTAQQPTVANGMIRYNSTTGKFEGGVGGVWTDFATGAGGTGTSADTQVLFNDGGVMAGNAQFTYDKTTNKLGIGTGSIRVVDRDNTSASYDIYGANVSGDERLVINSQGTPSGTRVWLDTPNDRAGLSMAYSGAERLYIGTDNNGGAGFVAYVPFNIADGTFTQRFSMLTNGKIGISNDSPKTQLDVNGTLRMGNGGEGCTTDTLGAMGYNSGDNKFYVCRTVAEGWVELNAGAGGGSIDALSDAATNYTKFNIALGEGAGTALTTGTNNAILGPYAANALTTGSDNIAFGFEALRNATGSSNIGIGSSTLKDATGSGNVGVGKYVLVKNTGADNVAIGLLAMNNNESGNDNVSIGSGSLYANVNGDSNVALGRDALHENTNGTNNVGIGAISLKNNTTGETNTAVGYYALGSNTTGSSNAALGKNALQANLTGAENTALGTAALENATASGNTAIGRSSGSSLTTGSGNTLIGFNVAQSGLTTGSNNILIGNSAAVTTPTVSTANYLNIGNAITGDLATGNLAINGTGALRVPSGTTAQRPTGVNGMMRYNTTTAGLEAYAGGAWTAIGGNAGQIWTDSGSGYIQYADSLGAMRVASVAGAAAPSTVTTTTSSGSSNLGTAAGSSSPSRSGEAGTGFFTSGTGSVSVAANSIETMRWNTTASGVNYLTGAAGAASAGPTLGTAGTDTNVPLNITTKGTGGIFLNNALVAYRASGNNLTLSHAGLATTGQVSMDLLTKAGGNADYVGNGTSKGWTMVARGDAYNVTGAQNDLLFSYWNGTGWKDAVTFDSVTGYMGLFNNAPAALIDLGMAGTTLGTMRLQGNTSGYVQIQPAAAAGSWTMTLPNSAGTAGYVLSTNGSGVTSWVANGTGGGAISALTAATAANTINNANFGQTWNWNSLTTGSGLTLGSSSVTTGSILSITNTNTTSAAETVKITTAGTTNNTSALSGYATGATGATWGLYGRSASANGIGVGGETTLAGGQGVVGVSLNTTGYGTGVSAVANSAGTGIGLYASSSGTSNTGYAVQAINNSANGWGIYSSGTSPNYFAGKVGIGTNAPGALLDIGAAGTTLGTMRLQGNTSGYVQIQPAAAAGSWTMTLPASAGTSGQVLSTNGAGVTSWVAASTGAAALSGLTAATAANTIANTNFAQAWNWNTLTTGTALALSSTSMTTGSLLSVSNTNTAAAAGTALSVNNASSGGTGLAATANTGAATAVSGSTTSTTAAAAGVKGVVTGASGASFGVYGSNTSTTGYGTAGQATATSGINYGTYGSSASAAGFGVYGTNSASGGTGVMGAVSSGAAAGVFGTTSSTTNTSYGVVGTATGGSGATAGIYGSTASTTGFGVYGLASNSSGANYGVYGTSASASGYGGYFNNTGSGTALYVNGNIQYTGTITDVSDMRRKTDIHPLRQRGSMLDKIDSIETYSFRMKGAQRGDIEFGVMAQQLETIFPELVKTAHDEMGTKSVNYIGLVAPLIEATKELHAENIALKTRIEALEDDKAEMQASLDDLARDVRGLKATTGYGFGQASIGLGAGFVFLFFLGGSAVFISVSRNRKRQE